MICVLHGENIVQSRRQLTGEIEKAQKEFIEVVRLDGKTISSPDLVLALESKSLFKNSRLIVIERLFSLPKFSEKEKLIKLISNNQDENIIIWEDKEIPSQTVRKYSPVFSFQLFKLSSVVFNFLDSLKPGDKKDNLENFHRCLAQEEPEMIFAMLIRQIRLLILAKEGEEFLEALSDWQKRKFFSQAKLFNLETLKRLYQKLLDIDFQQKTSQSPFDLSSSLDLLISEI